MENNTQRAFKINKTLITDFFYIFTLFFISFKLVFGVSQVIEILFADESASLFYGVGFKAKFIFRDGFIYFLWYKLLSFVFTDPILLYCYNYVILSTINAIFIYVVLRKLGKGTFFSFLASLIFLISGINVFTWPFITRFALTIILITVIFIISLKSNKSKYLAALSGFLLLAYTRTEFFVALVLFFIISVVLLIYRYHSSRQKVYLKFIFITLSMALLVLFIKNPLRSNRSVWAFGQHYTLNLYNAGQTRMSPWVGNGWRKVMIEKFETDQSLIKAFFNNPAEMKRHIFTNTKNFPVKLFYSLSPFFGNRIPIFIKYMIKWLMVSLILISGFCFISSIYSRIKRDKTNLLNLFNLEDNLFYLFTVLIAFSSLISICLIYPRQHYILILSVILYLLILKNLPTVPSPGKYGIFVAIPVWFVVVVFVPWRVSGSSGLLPGNFKKYCSDLKRMQVIKSVEVNTAVNFFGNRAKKWEKHAYFKKYVNYNKPNNFRIFRKKEATFDEFFNKKKINMVLVDKRLIKNPQFTSSSIFLGLISSEEGANQWERFEIPNCSEYLLVNKKILK
jgi:hypothetical protein